jgi:hypothetical protein
MAAVLEGLDAGIEIDSFGFGSTSAKIARPRPAASRISSAFWVIAIECQAAVGDQQRLLDAERSCRRSASSLIRPRPSLTDVG